MSSSIEYLPVDRALYTERLASFLPDDIVDVHTHVWRAGDIGADDSNKGRAVSWPSLVARDNPYEDLVETYRILMPGKRVTPIMFAGLPNDSNIDRLNAYVAECARASGAPALLFTHPRWSAATLTQRLRDGGFVGAKGYLTLAPDWIPGKEIRIFDFFPPHQLAVHDRLGSIVMLHIPRDGRLRDRLNLAQLLEIERDYPNLKLIVAHVGRAYCDEDVGDAFDVLAETRNMVFDFCANTNAQVFEQLLRAVGPQRVLFGSDLPITRMRMRRVVRDGRYVNLVPKGKYGDVSADPNMDEVEGAESESLSLFLYEQLDSFRRAAESVGLTRAEVEAVFAGNAWRLLGREPAKAPGEAA